MSGQRRLDGDLRSLTVTNFTNNDLVRIVTQNRSKAAGKSQALLFIDWNLCDSPNLVFNQILNGENLILFISDFHERGIESCGLATAGRASHKDHTVRLADVMS